MSAAPIEPGTHVRIKDGVRSEHVGVIATVGRQIEQGAHRPQRQYWLTANGRPLGWFAVSEFEVVAGPSS